MNEDQTLTSIKIMLETTRKGTTPSDEASRKSLYTLMMLLRPVEGPDTSTKRLPIPWFAAFLLWFFLNFVTLTTEPGAWTDEVMFTDPAIHLATGSGFVSEAWFNQPRSQFWAGYTPLYSFVLAGWLRIFDVSQWAVRSFCLIVMTLALIFLWLLLDRLNTFLPRLPRLSIWLSVAGSKPLMFLSRAGRPDGLSVLILLATVLIWFRRSSRIRTVGLFSLGFLASTSAIQLVIFTILIGLLIQAWWRPFTLRDSALWIYGVAGGALFLAALYIYHHVLDVFLQMTLFSTHSSIGRLAQQIILKSSKAAVDFRDLFTAPLRDYATPVLLGFAALVCLSANYSRNQLAKKMSLFALIAGLAIPFIIQFLGKYPLYYAYMAVIPTAIAAGSAFAMVGRTPFALRAVAILAIFLIILSGAGKVWFQALSRGIRSVGPDTLSEITAQDVVMVDFSAYYQIQRRTRHLFAISYGGGKKLRQLPAAEAEQVTKLLIYPSTLSDVQAKVGGSWRPEEKAQMIRSFVTGYTFDDTAAIDSSGQSLYLYVRTEQ
jgi:hypothetical protein